MLGLKKVGGFDIIGDSYKATQLRSDVADLMVGIIDRVHELGSKITTAGGLRQITDANRPGTSKTSLHYLGLAIDIAPYTGLQDPTSDNFVIEQTDRSWIVWARSSSAPAKTLTAGKWKNGKLTFDKITGKFINISEIFEEFGFSSINPRSAFPLDYMSAEWWHFQVDSVLEPGRAFNDYLEEVWTPEQIEACGISAYKNYTWNGSTFKGGN